MEKSSLSLEILRFLEGLNCIYTLTIKNLEYRNTFSFMSLILLVQHRNFMPHFVSLSNTRSSADALYELLHSTNIV